MVGDDGPPPAARVQNNQILSHGEDRGGDDSEGNDEGGKGGDGGRGYEDGGDGGDDNAKWRQTQQSNIKPTSTMRTVVVTTARGDDEGGKDGGGKKEKAKILPVDGADP